MDLVVLGASVVKMMKQNFHDLMPFIIRLENDPIAVQLKKITRLIGYRVEVFTDVFEHDSQIDEFIMVSVIDGYGKEITNGYGGCLTSYEPIFIHDRSGKVREIDDWFDETIREIKRMVDTILSGRFIVEGIEVEKGVFDSSIGSVEILNSWKENKVCYCIIQLRETCNLSSFPKIGEEIILEDKTGRIVSLVSE